jgi:hypothetical protein
MIDWTMRLEAEWERRATNVEVIRLGSSAIETIARQIAANASVLDQFAQASAEHTVEEAADQPKVEQLRLFLGPPAASPPPCAVASFELAATVTPSLALCSRGLCEYADEANARGPAGALRAVQGATPHFAHKGADEGWRAGGEGDAIEVRSSHALLSRYPQGFVLR